MGGFFSIESLLAGKIPFQGMTVAQVCKMAQSMAMANDLNVIMAIHNPETNRIEVPPAMIFRPEEGLDSLFHWLELSLMEIVRRDASDTTRWDRFREYVGQRANSYWQREAENLRRQLGRQDYSAPIPADPSKATTKGPRPTPTPAPAKPKTKARPTESATQAKSQTGTDTIHSGNNEAVEGIIDRMARGEMIDFIGEATRAGIPPAQIGDIGIKAAERRAQKAADDYKKSQQEGQYRDIPDPDQEQHAAETAARPRRGGQEPAPVM